jgi:tetratricopeptide (TPR) repeat protein
MSSAVRESSVARSVHTWRHTPWGCIGLILVCACARAPSLPPGPVVSPTGIVFQEGTPPSETRFSQTATMLLKLTGSTERGLEQALEGIASDSTNPIHFFLAGAAYARLGEYAEADRMFTRAQQIYPAYELQIEPEREAAWADAFNQGARAYGEGDVERAIEAWEGAIGMFDLRPEAHRSLAQLHVGEGRLDEAITAYEGALAGLEKRPVTRVMQDPEIRELDTLRVEMESSLADLYLFRNRFAEAEPVIRRLLARDSTNADLRGNLAAALVGLGRTDEARTIYTSLLSETGLEVTQLFNLGVALFRANDFSAAARAFQRLTELQTDSRDAWFNYANSLFAAQEWGTLASAGARLIDLDPLNENAGLITARALLELGDQSGALRGVERVKSAPIYLEGLTVRAAVDETKVQGRIKGNRADTGGPIRLQFTFYGDDGALGSMAVNVAAPPEGSVEPFEITFRMKASSYSYTVIP